MIALGLDISTQQLALATFDDHADHHTFSVMLDPKARGARRLCHARASIISALRFRDIHADVCVIEVAWPGFALLSMTAVCMEAIQHTYPGAIVMEVSAGTWKKEALGHGKASKQDALDHAAGLGYPGTDDNEAEALCMAQVGMERLLTRIGRDVA